MDRITQSSLNRFAHLFAAETLVSRPICRYPELGNDAFAECSSVTEVSLPNGIVALGEGAFFRC